MTAKGKKSCERPVSILYVCTGNICRSPLGEAQLRDYAASRGLGERLVVSSAGTHAWDGNPATPEAIIAGARHGLDLTGHRAREVRRSIIDAADIILTMTRQHYNFLLHSFRESKNKLYLALLFLREFEGQPQAATEVPDPIGESVGFYLDVLEMLKPTLPGILSAALGEETT